MRPIAPLLAITVAASLFGAGCGGSAEPSEKEAGASGTSVEIKTFQYDPDPITIKAGETVKWTNADGTVHTVTAGTRKQPAPDEFDGQLPEGESFSQSFDEPGTYDYFCTLHSGPGMTGKVVVQ